MIHTRVAKARGLEMARRGRGGEQMGEKRRREGGGELQKLCIDVSFVAANSVDKVHQINKQPRFEANTRKQKLIHPI